MKNYTIAQLAYLAGIIDGEGSIYIGNFSANKKTGAKYYQTNIEVTNTDENLIDWLVTHIGGRKYTYSKNQTPKNSRKQVFRWIVNGDLVTQLCSLLFPYIVIKKQQCEIMLKMRKTFEHTSMKKGKQGIQNLPLHILEEREKYFHQMQSLHCRNYNL